MGAGVVAGVVDGAVVVVVVVVVFEEELSDCELPVEEISVSGAVVVCGVVDEDAGVVAEGVVGCVTFFRSYNNGSRDNRKIRSYAVS